MRLLDAPNKVSMYDAPKFEVLRERLAPFAGVVGGGSFFLPFVANADDRIVRGWREDVEGNADVDVDKGSCSSSVSTVVVVVTAT